MPYLAFDLDAKKRVHPVARASGVSPAEIAWGLLELWEFVWTSKSDAVTTLVLDGCFGPSDRIRDSLVTFGFLEPLDDGFRVRGTEKYLRIASPSERGQLGGKKTAETGKSKTNLRQFAATEATPKQTEANAFASEKTTEANTEAARSNTEALSPNTQHPAPKDLFAGSAIADPPAKKPKAEKPTDPRHAPLVKAMCEAFFELAGAKLDFTGQDARAVTELLAKAEPEEILRRWRLSVVAQFYRCAYPHELAKKWNHFAGDGPLSAKPKPQQPPQQRSRLIS
jgi:hypothetical protein